MYFIVAQSVNKNTCSTVLMRDEDTNYWWEFQWIQPLWRAFGHIHQNVNVAEPLWLSS